MGVSGRAWFMFRAPFAHINKSQYAALLVVCAFGFCVGFCCNLCHPGVPPVAKTRAVLVFAPGNIFRLSFSTSFAFCVLSETATTILLLLCYHTISAEEDLK